MQQTTLQGRVEAIRERMRAAGDHGQVTLLAAVKYATAEQINALHRDCGIHDIGENRVQQLLEHYEQLEDRENLRIHFIGSLQKNKVKYIVDKVCMIHSLDSLSLAEEIEKRCAAIGRVMDVLVEVNSGLEASKGGLAPGDVEAFCQKLEEFPHLRLRGFMTMAPKCENLAQYRKYFGETYRQCLDIWQKKLDNIGSTQNMPSELAPVFSMGMSGSFEAAIAEGATIVRIGGALFRDEP
ncbi:MAG: YggS family pyridoxal phosphate-dependent enzyme [Clostridia bacterium]|nr:YggS family pyridoxal phosphate-dependent enzyme [Clostridia bacterium]MBR5798129.1 YggS family pyridoxal phosphate-dependent enzyme [Clostridia bacterium]